MQLIIGFVTMLVSSTAVRAFVARIFVALGISVLTYSGVSVAMVAAFAAANDALGTVGASALSVLTLCKVPNALNVLASAYTAALTIKGLIGAGVLKKISWGGAGSVISP